jgi:hypothetical protein
MSSEILGKELDCAEAKRPLSGLSSNYEEKVYTYSSLPSAHESSTADSRIGVHRSSHPEGSSTVRISLVESNLTSPETGNSLHVPEEDACVVEYESD